jgi:hypothetical protein
MPPARRGKVALGTGAALVAIVAVVIGLAAGTGRPAALHNGAGPAGRDPVRAVGRSITVCW